MRRLVKYVLCAALPSWCGSPCFAQEADPSDMLQDLGVKRLSSVSLFQQKLDEDKSDWYQLASGGLKAAWSEDDYRVQLNTSAGEVLDLADIGFLRKVQLEFSASSSFPSYALLGSEFAFTHDVSFFVAGVNVMTDNEEPEWYEILRPIGGPIIYWGKSHSILMFYPNFSGSKEGALVARNRIREFGDYFWADFDMSYKAKQTTDGLKHRLGTGITLGLWKVAASYKYQPFYEGTLKDRQVYEVSYLYNL